MASFQAKIGWKWLRMKENKNYISVLFLPDWLEKIPKKQQKNSKNFKIQLWHHFKPKQDGNDREKEKIKIIVPFRSIPFLPDRLEKIPKKQQKNSKN